MKRYLVAKFGKFGLPDGIATSWFVLGVNYIQDDVNAVVYKMN